ncbi:MAG: HPr(Ser) kinase/phosphatase [Verrucomicrobiae bacterium]|nr:HPr(Ser) kinase/phosphatase [Verrucomicrobiae bacterium]
MPKAPEHISVEEFHRKHAQTLQLQLVGGASGLARKIREGTVNRPGLALAGFFRYFADKRIQVIGSAESTYLKSLSARELAMRIKQLFDRKIPCLIFARNIRPSREILRVADKEKVPVFVSPLVTMNLINKATILLEQDFAPQSSEFASMVDIGGIGVLIRGKSGVGKSECVLALIERGYALVSDDVTYIRADEGRELFGRCPEMTRNHIEVRGLGIINVAAVFGVRSIQDEKKIDLVVTLIDWNGVEDVDRIGLDAEYYTILGINVRHVTIPVRPGRDIARLVEVAALDSKLKTMGFDAAQEFNRRLIEKMKK